MGDSMMPADVPRFMNALGVRSATEISRLNDTTIETVIRKGGYGRQRIQGDVMYSDGTKRVPMNVSFTVFGQRYTIDSHVFHEITVDRGPLEMPDSFHTAFAVLGNDFALQLRAAQHPGLQELGPLNRMRVFVEAQPDEYWDSSLYPAWLAALKTLSPERKRDTSLPRVTRTDAWQRRILAAQLASWSELRHDTILYAKQSYTMSVLCKFPDAYVDPYPDFYRGLKAANQLGAQVIERIRTAMAPIGKLPFLDNARNHFNRAADVMSKLEEIAEREIDKKPVTDAELDWVNTMIRDHYQSSGHGCGGGSTTYDGWYKDLLYTADLADPEYSVADVHTDSHGQVLHVAKGPPLRFIVAVDGPSGPRAFVGVTYSFNQFVHGGRMTDSEWQRHYSDTPTEAWLRPITAYPRSGRETPDTASDIELEP